MLAWLVVLGLILLAYAAMHVWFLWVIVLCHQYLRQSLLPQYHVNYDQPGNTLLQWPPDQQQSQSERSTNQPAVPSAVFTTGAANHLPRF